MAAVSHVMGYSFCDLTSHGWEISRSEIKHTVGQGMLIATLTYLIQLVSVDFWIGQILGHCIGP